MAAIDKYAANSADLVVPITGAFSVTPHDSNELTHVTRAICVAAAGDVAVVMHDGSTITLPALQAGVFYPIRVRTIKATGTTATGIIGLC